MDSPWGRCVTLVQWLTVDVPVRRSHTRCCWIRTPAGSVSFPARFDRF